LTRRLPGRRDSVGIRLITRRGNDWSDRLPLVVDALNHFKVRSCLIHGEVVCCGERGLAQFDVLRRRRNEEMAFLYAFDLLELDGLDLRQEPLEIRKAALAVKSRYGVHLNEYLAQDCGLTVGQHACKWGWSGLSRSG
jgi:bifunctional non-homologous end joining protein LigD